MGKFYRYSWWKSALIHAFLGLQDSFSSSMERISDLHDWTMLVVVGVVSLVLYLILAICSMKSALIKFTFNEMLEMVWTVVPMIVLFALSLVSLRSLYLLEEVENPDMTVKVTGHQWYWSYECEVFKDKSFDSYLLPSSDIKNSGFRLLEVDNPLPLPVDLEIRLLITSEDVVHSWAVPSLGLKMDGVPGRLNQIVVNINRAGVLYGQCSEMCGAFHSFMPIKVECFSS
nr:cytochrome c oxidase subunit 2 [Degeeriella rufa]